MFVHNCLSHMVTMISDTEIFPCHDIKIFSIFSPDMHLYIAPSCFSVLYCTIYSFLWSVQRKWIVNFIVLFRHLQMPARIYAKKAISSLEDVDISIQFVIKWSGWQNDLYIPFRTYQSTLGFVGCSWYSWQLSSVEWIQEGSF